MPCLGSIRRPLLISIFMAELKLYRKGAKTQRKRCLKRDDEQPFLSDRVRNNGRSFAVPEMIMRKSSFASLRLCGKTFRSHSIPREDAHHRHAHRDAEGHLRQDHRMLAIGDRRVDL